MIRTLLLLLSLFSGLVSYGQGIVFLHENCEPPSNADTLNSALLWHVEDSVAYPGMPGNHYLRAKIMTITNDSLWALPIYPDTAVSSYFMEFDHICKTDPLDYCALQYHTQPPDTIPWRHVPETCYLGTAYNGIPFSSWAYPKWQGLVTTAIPDSSWWQHEKFDITPLVIANGINNPFYLRFYMKDAGLPGANKNYGWLIDNVSVNQFLMPVGIDKPTTPTTVNILTGFQCITVQNTDYREVLVYDITGRIVAQRTLTAGTNQITMEREGIFIVRLIKDGNSVCRKVIINK